MPVAPVDEIGTAIYYDDAGAPKDSKTYLTVVLLHGIFFHSDIFRRLVPYAEKLDLRLVCINWRDYPNSTAYTAAELDIISNGDEEAKRAFVKTQGLQLAGFLEYFVQTHDVPKIEEVGEKKTGGMALLSWSMGNIWSVSLLGNAQEFPHDIKNCLEGYLRTVVLYDPAAASCCGIPPAPAGLEAAKADLTTIFRSLISSYYPKVEDLSQVTLEYLSSRIALHEELGDSQTSTSQQKTPTTRGMSDKEFDALTHPNALRSNFPILSFPPAIFRDNFQRALRPTGDTLPDVKVLVLWGNESINDCVLAAKAIGDFVLETIPRDKANTKRSVEIHPIDGGNHFAHWDIPEVVADLLARLA